MKAKDTSRRRIRQRGSALFFVAAGLVTFIGLMGIAIDLVALYLGKSEAQRSADAAALAGATVFVTTGCTSLSTGCAAAETLATNQAVNVGQANKVGGAAPTIPAGNVTYDLSHAGDPLITVVVNATLPTFFMKIFGVTSANISATATAEAFNPSGSPGSGPPLCVTCLKPFLVPNCDPNHLTPANPNCTGGASGNAGGAFIKTDGSIANPGPYPTGVIGEPWTLHLNQAPSHWYEIAFDCSQSGSNWATDVQKCSTNVFNCGSTLCVLDGAKVGPNGKGVCSLIDYTSSNKQTCTSADSITVNASNTPPFTITAGAGNPFFPSGSQITQSASILAVPVFNGADIKSGGTSVTVVGYLQLFIKGITHAGGGGGGGGPDDTIDAIIMNVSSCGVGGGTCGTGGSGQGSGGTVAGGGQGFVPVRLVHP